MQGLGSGPISLFGTREQREAYLPGVIAGSIIAFERLQPPPERDLKERAKQQVRWARTNWRFVKKEAKAMVKPAAKITDQMAPAETALRY